MSELDVMLEQWRNDESFYSTNRERALIAMLKKCREQRDHHALGGPKPTGNSVAEKYDAELLAIARGENWR